MKKTYQGRAPTSERRDSQNESPMRIVPSKSVHKNSAIVPVSLGGDVMLLILECVTLESRLSRHPEFHSNIGVVFSAVQPTLYDTMEHGQLIKRSVPAAFAGVLSFRSTNQSSNIP